MRGTLALPKLKASLSKLMGEVVGVKIERRDVEQAAGQVFGRAAADAGFVGSVEDSLDLGEQG